MDIIKVSGTSRTSAVAGAIAGVFRENKRVEVQAIGAGAVNQAVKALVLAKGYLAEDGYDVVFTPEFTEVEIEGNIRTAIKLTVETRSGETAPSRRETEDDLAFGNNNDGGEEMEEERETDESPDPFS
jgi:stage V sporulation protein S